MTLLTTNRLAGWLCLAAGALDSGAGLGLVFAPARLLPLLGVAAPGAEALVFLRWVGAFVAAVGASYLLALARGGGARLRAALEFTISFRVAAGAFSAGAILLGWLGPAWAAVPVTDFLLVGAQGWLLAKGVGRDE